MNKELEKNSNSETYNFLYNYIELGFSIGAFDEKQQQMFGKCLKELKALEIIKDLLEIEMFVGANKRVDYVLHFKEGKHAVNVDEEKFDSLKEVLL